MDTQSDPKAAGFLRFVQERYPDVYEICRQGVEKQENGRPSFMKILSDALSSSQALPDDAVVQALVGREIPSQPGGLVTVHKDEPSDEDAINDIIEALDSEEGPPITDLPGLADALLRDQPS